MTPDRRGIERRQKGDHKGGFRSLDRRKWVGRDSDRRTLVRLHETVPVLLSPEEETFKEFRETSVDINGRGMQIHSEREFAIGAKLNLCLYPPELFIPIQVDGRVAWRRYDLKTKSFRYGLSFRDVTGDYQTLLDQFVSERQLNPQGQHKGLEHQWNQFFYKRLVKTVLGRSLIGQRAVLGRSDSGFTFDHIYSNQAKGSGWIGRLLDKMLLELPASKASRYRKDLIKEAVRHEVRSNMLIGQMTRVLDLGSGTARYLFESIGTEESPYVQALCVDRDRESISNGRGMAGSRPFRFLRADIFKTRRLESLGSKLDWRPNVIVVSGLIYYFSDRKVKALLAQIAEWLEPGGMLILTNMIQNPNKKLIGHLFTTQDGDPWIPLARPTHLVRQWLVEAGFGGIHHTKDPWGMYSVFSARKEREKIKKTGFEFRAEGNILRGKIYKPVEPSKPHAMVLFIHGLGYTYSTYKLSPGLFCEQGVGIAMFNMASHANSTGEWSLEASVAAVSRAIDSIVEHSRQDVPIFLFAHSTGALIALLAAQHDQRVRGAAFVNIVTSVTDSYLHWHHSGYSEEVKEYFMAGGLVPPIIDDFLNDPSHMKAYQSHQKSWSDLEFPYRYGLMKGQSFAPLARAICFSPDVLKLSKEIRVPLMLFVGEKDNVIPIEKTEQLALRLKGRAEVVKTGSHDHFQSDHWGEIQKKSLEFFRGLLA